MRISDWSSDVCSSDLGEDQCCRFRQAKAPAYVSLSCCVPLYLGQFARLIRRERSRLENQLVNALVRLYGSANAGNACRNIAQPLDEGALQGYGALGLGRDGHQYGLPSSHNPEQPSFYSSSARKGVVSGQSVSGRVEQ